MKLRTKFVLAAVAGLIYAGSAFSPASVYAKDAKAISSKGTFLQETTGHSQLFIHITVADILHNNPCHPSDNLSTCAY